MTILLNTGCIDLRSVPGSVFWLDGWPLPFTPADYGSGSERTFCRKKCKRAIVCEGATHDGTTYTSLGTVTKYWLRKQAPALALDRPVWDRGEREAERWTSATLFDPSGYLNVSGPADTVSWTGGGATSFDIDTLTGRARVFAALVTPQPPDAMPATTSADVAAGGASIPMGVALDTEKYNAGGFSTGRLMLRVGSDPTIYTASISGSSLLVSPGLAVAAPAGTAIAFVRGIPMPPEIPHDLLLECEVFEFVTWRKPVPGVPGGKVSAQLAGIRITPHLYYWKCEPRAHYA